MTTPISGIRRTRSSRVIAQITADYQHADPGDRAYFEQRRKAFESKALAGYNRLIHEIKARYSGTAVGASESIFAPLAPALGLRLVTPPGFLDAISEGTEPTPAEKATTDQQITGHQIKVWVYNSQNATPDVQRLNDEAKAAGIPITTVTETLVPQEPPSRPGRCASSRACAPRSPRRPGDDPRPAAGATPQTAEPSREAGATAATLSPLPAQRQGEADASSGARSTFGSGAGSSSPSWARTVPGSRPSSTSSSDFSP